MKNNGKYRRGNHRRNRNNNMPKTFGMREALGVSALALSELARMIGSGIARFWEVSHSIHYNI